MALRKELQPNIETAVHLYSQVLEHLKAYQQFFSTLPRDAYNNVEAAAREQWSKEFLTLVDDLLALLGRDMVDKVPLLCREDMLPDIAFQLSLPKPQLVSDFSKEELLAVVRLIRKLRSEDVEAPAPFAGVDYTYYLAAYYDGLLEVNFRNYIGDLLTAHPNKQGEYVFLSEEKIIDRIWIDEGENVPYLKTVRLRPECFPDLETAERLYPLVLARLQAYETFVDSQEEDTPEEVYETEYAAMEQYLSELSGKDLGSTMLWEWWEAEGIEKLAFDIALPSPKKVTQLTEDEIYTIIKGMGYNPSLQAMGYTHRSLFVKEFSSFLNDYFTAFLKLNCPKYSHSYFMNGTDKQGEIQCYSKHQKAEKIATK